MRECDLTALGNRVDRADPGPIHLRREEGDQPPRGGGQAGTVPAGNESAGGSGRSHAAGLDHAGRGRRSPGAPATATAPAAGCTSPPTRPPASPSGCGPPVRRGGRGSADPRRPDIRRAARPGPPPVVPHPRRRPSPRPRPHGPAARPYGTVVPAASPDSIRATVLFGTPARAASSRWLRSAGRAAPPRARHPPRSVRPRPRHPPRPRRRLCPARQRLPSRAVRDHRTLGHTLIVRKLAAVLNYLPHSCGQACGQLAPAVEVVIGRALSSCPVCAGSSKARQGHVAEEQGPTIRTNRQPGRGRRQPGRGGRQPGRGGRQPGPGARPECQVNGLP
ncbi:hypothetical protein GA0074694_1904 [Micromonospora inyonensis]|uniref:Uncharacterized protein n=1 Tax=Micromonospora inyonensis TaxID=47866 RepID=A0A1C6RJ46_9ACTN|nr:hypothetical protein GA0074694_1904 [Micromonospora inyonensis]